MQVASLTAVNTTLAAAAGGISVILLQAALGKPCEIGAFMNGILAGRHCSEHPCARSQMAIFVANLILVQDGISNLMLGTIDQLTSQEKRVMSSSVMPA